MAGHSKWANIKHRKGKQDAVKGKIFTKLIRAITIAARNGADVSANSTLRLAVDKALSQNMSRDTIDRAIKRGVGGEDANTMEEIYYEGYGAGGVAVLADCLTDNRNRTVSDVRHAFTKCGGALGSSGSVAYLFKKQGVITFEPGTEENKVMEIVLESGAEDVVTNEDKSVDIITTPENFAGVRDALEKADMHPAQAEISMLAATTIAITDQEIAEKIIRLIDMLEELDDVQNVYTNAEIPEEFYG